MSDYPVLDGNGDPIIPAGQGDLPNNINKFGWWDYNDAATASAPISLEVAGTYYVMTNDGAGANTITAFRPDGLSPIWDVATNRFDFSELRVGDVVDLRLDFDITIAGNNREIKTRIVVAEGSATEFSLELDVRQFKTAGLYHFIVLATGYIGSEDVRDYPARVEMTSDVGGDTVVVNGWFAKLFGK